MIKDVSGGTTAIGFTGPIFIMIGAAWAFAPNTSVIFGYDIYNNDKIAGANTFTVQLDINLW